MEINPEFLAKVFSEQAMELKRLREVAEQVPPALSAGQDYQEQVTGLLLRIALAVEASAEGQNERFKAGIGSPHTGST
jgi:hypothetical protein